MRPPPAAPAGGQVFLSVLEDDGVIPNSQLPLVIYEQAFRVGGQDPAGIFERAFASHGWGGTWRDGIYSYHHYHSTAHEVLGIYAGSATVLLGGEHGIRHRLEAGDVVLIPAGVAHKNLGATADFGVVGAYPEGQEPDMCYGRAGERPGADHRIAGVALPLEDPVYGRNGPLRVNWR